MKKLTTLFTLLLTVTTLTSCQKDTDNTPETPETPVETNTSFVGSVVVSEEGASDYYVKEDITVVITAIHDTTLDFVMNGVRFAENMPMTIDMGVEGVSYSVAGDTYSLSGDNIIPTAMGGPFDRFPIGDLSGEFNTETMTLSFLCGTYPVKFEGTIVK